MAAIRDNRTIYAPFSNAVELVKATYDFAADGGATGALDVLTAGAALVICGFWANVKTAVLSSGSATVIAGITGSTSLFFGATTGAKANLTLAKFLQADTVEGTPNVVALPAKLASADKILQTIGTAALTAGKIEYSFLIAKF